MPIAMLESNIVVYDMDGTLFRGDCGGAFIKQQIRGNLLRLLLAAVIAPAAFPMLHIPSLRKLGVSAYLWIASIGLSETAYTTILNNFIAQYRIRPIESVLSECRKDIVDGKRVVIATGAGYEMASAFIKHLGMENQVGLVTSKSRRFFGGMISSLQSNGEVKLQELIKHGYPPPYLRAYSDTASDLPILQAASKAFLVNYREKDRKYLSQKLGEKLRLIDHACM
ncbi:MAG: haloacid dehalogenase-like hydrolase [Arenimonas sp.]